MYSPQVVGRPNSHSRKEVVVLLRYDQADPLTSSQCYLSFVLGYAGSYDLLAKSTNGKCLLTNDIHYNCLKGGDKNETNGF